MNKYLLKQLELHPSMTAIDIIKFTYQSVFGPEHLFRDDKEVENYFYEEFDVIEAKDIPLYEEISDKYVRVNLASWKYHNLDPKLLFGLFSKSAIDTDISQLNFINAFQDIEDTIKGIDKFSDFDSVKNEYLSTYINRPVHHSNIYKEKEKPSYRLVSKDLILEHNIKNY